MPSSKKSQSHKQTKTLRFLVQVGFWLLLGLVLWCSWRMQYLVKYHWCADGLFLFILTQDHHQTHGGKPWSYIYNPIISNLRPVLWTAPILPWISWTVIILNLFPGPQKVQDKMTPMYGTQCISFTKAFILIIIDLKLFLFFFFLELQ